MRLIYIYHIVQDNFIPLSNLIKNISIFLYFALMSVSQFIREPNLLKYCRFIATQMEINSIVFIHYACKLSLSHCYVLFRSDNKRIMQLCAKSYTLTGNKIKNEISQSFCNNNISITQKMQTCLYSYFRFEPKKKKKTLPGDFFYR